MINCIIPEEELIDEAAETIKQEEVYSPDPEIDNIFSATKDALDSIDGAEAVMDMSVNLAEYITKCYYALKF